MDDSEALLRMEREHGRRDPASSWYVEGWLADKGRDDPLAPAADGDGHAFNSGRGPELNDVGPTQPVRVRVYRGADKATVLAMLDKMRVEVEQVWATNSLEWDAAVSAMAFEDLERMRHAPAEHDRRDATFGVCPICKGQDGFLNVGRVHWFVCDAHRTRWRVGENLFSSWRDEDEATWRENERKLADYEEVEPAEE